MKPKEVIKVNSKNLNKFQFPIQGTNPAIIDALQQKF